MTFQDHFSDRARRYADARPTYPPALFAKLAAQAPGHALAWDCGTGNGQAALGLAVHFDAVLATDPSEAQLAHARPHPRVTYRIAPESRSWLPDHSADLVTAAQAAHWFELSLFNAEARRVLRPGGLVAIWCYSLCRISPEIDPILGTFYRETVGPYWPPERRHTEDGYRSLEFPFEELPFPELTMEHDWTAEQFGAYVGTWSAVGRFIKARGFDPVPSMLEAIAPVWSGPQRITWPLSGRLGRARSSLNP